MSPSTGSATWSASTCIGASVLSKDEACIAKAKHFGIRGEDEESARAQRALQNRARYGAQRFFRLVAKRGRTLKTNEAENRQHQAQPDTRDRTALQPQLWPIEV